MSIPNAATINIIPNRICMVCFLDCLIYRYTENNMPHSKVLTDMEVIVKGVIKSLFLSVFPARFFLHKL